MPKPSPKRWRGRTCASCRIKTDDQLDLQALHRVRDRLVKRRTAVINQIRGFLLERGITFAKGRRSLRNQMADGPGRCRQNLTPRMRDLLDQLWGRSGSNWRATSQWLSRRDRADLPATMRPAGGCVRFPAWGRWSPPRRSRPIGNGAAFRKGREFAAWLGAGAASALHRRQDADYSGSASAATFICGACSSTGHAPCCFAYATTRAVLVSGCNSSRRAPRNKVIVAVANKLARIVWAVLFRGEAYRTPGAAAQC